MLAQDIVEVTMEGWNWLRNETNTMQLFFVYVVIPSKYSQITLYLFIITIFAFLLITVQKIFYMHSVNSNSNSEASCIMYFSQFLSKPLLRYINDPGGIRE